MHNRSLHSCHLFLIGAMKWESEEAQNQRFFPPVRQDWDHWDHWDPDHDANARTERFRFFHVMCGEDYLIGDRCDPPTTFQVVVSETSLPQFFQLREVAAICRFLELTNAWQACQVAPTRGSLRKNRNSDLWFKRKHDLPVSSNQVAVLSLRKVETEEMTCLVSLRRMCSSAWFVNEYVLIL